MFLQKRGFLPCPLGCEILSCPVNGWRRNQVEVVGVQLLSGNTANDREIYLDSISNKLKGFHKKNYVLIHDIQCLYHQT